MNRRFYKSLSYLLRTVAAVALAVVLVAGCGSSGENSSQTASYHPSPTTTVVPVRGIDTVAPTEAAGILASNPGVVLIDIRTPEEFADGIIEGAVNADFESTEFVEQIALLDPEVPYVIYCRSGNRSSQALPLFEELGFTSVVDVDGGIAAWAGAGLPVVAP